MCNINRNVDSNIDIFRKHIKVYYGSKLTFSLQTKKNVNNFNYGDSVLTENKNMLINFLNLFFNDMSRNLYNNPFSQNLNQNDNYTFYCYG